MRSSATLLRVLCCATCACLMLASVAWAAAPVLDDVQLDLHADAVATGKTVLLGDLLSIQTQNSALQTRMGALAVAPVPRPGAMEKYTRGELEQFVRSHLLPYTGKLSWVGANSVKVHAAAQMLQTGDMVDAVKQEVMQTLGARFSHVGMELAAPVPALDLSPGKVSWQVRAVDADHLLSRLPVWVDISVDGRYSRTAVLSYALKLGQIVRVARRDLPAGSVIAESDFDSKQEDVTEVVQEVLQANEFEAGARTKKSIRKGQILMRDQLSPQGMVLRGDSVKLLLSDGGLQIETRAIAEQDGVIGQRVKIRPETSVAAVTGLIVGPGVVRVEGM